MYYDQLQKEILKDIVERQVERWPEKAFCSAGWEELSKRAILAYKALAARRYTFPHEARLGSEIIRGLEKPLPYLWTWSSHRGIIFCPPQNVDCSKAHYASIVRIASSFVFRIYAQDTAKIISFHKVDVEDSSGEYLNIVPNGRNSSTIVTREDLRSLTNRLRDQKANNQVDAYQWRCDENSGIYIKDLIHVVLIANWTDLGSSHNTRCTEEQKAIVKFLKSNEAARNGIYFVICSSSFFELPGVPLVVIENREPPLREQDTDLAGIFYLPPMDKGEENPVSRTKQISLIFASPTQQQIKNLQDAQREFESGAVEDEDADGIWKGNSTMGLRCIIGVTPKKKPQYFELGIGRGEQAYHALVGGTTGSGKSVLLNEMICSLAERYSPMELRFVLLDYKEGTEFAPYRQLPHVLALSIGTNQEFGFETLKWLSKEIERRGALFKEVNVNNISGYRHKTGETLCRFVVIADEFQVLCSDKKHGDEARHYLNDLARRGRSFGMHLILSTQTLRDGALEGEAREQIACRICLQLAEQETGYFLGSDNTEPAKFSQKGQALLNYYHGRKEENIFFLSGHIGSPNGFRDREEVQKLVSNLHHLVNDKNLQLEKPYIYDADTPVDVNVKDLDPDKGIILGVKGNMKGDPFVITKQRLMGGILIVGANVEQNKCLLEGISLQMEVLFGQTCPIHTAKSYLDRDGDMPLTLLQLDESDSGDIEDALEEWLDVRDRKREAKQLRIDENRSATARFQAPAGMESEFSELVGSLNMNVLKGQETGGHHRSRVRQELPLIVSSHSAEDVKLIYSLHDDLTQFRIKVYTDSSACNYFSMGGVNERLSASQVVVEFPRGEFTKIRLAYIHS